jgi:hypothetical protein
MPACPTTFPYLSRKFNKIVLRFPVPGPAQAIVGRKMFRLVLQQTDMAAAHAASLPILAEWRQQIAAALATGADHRAAAVLKFRTGFERYRDKPLSADQIDLLVEIYEFVASQGGVTEIERRAIRAEARNEMSRTVLALPARARGAETLALIDGSAAVVTRFLTQPIWRHGKSAPTCAANISLLRSAIPRCSRRPCHARWKA